MSEINDQIERRKPPFSPEQAEALAVLMEDHVRRGVAKGVKQDRRRGRAAYLGLLLGLVLAFQQVEHTRTEQRAQAQAQRHSIVQSGRAVAVDGCNRDFHTITGLRGLLITARKLNETAAEKGTITKDQLKQSEAFYDSQLVVLAQPDCREAESLLTDNPSAKIVVPKPLYPKPQKKG